MHRKLSPMQSVGQMIYSIFSYGSSEPLLLPSKESIKAGENHEDDGTATSGKRHYFQLNRKEGTSTSTQHTQDEMRPT